MFDSDRLNFNVIISCDKGQEKFKGVSVGFNGVPAYPFDMGKIVTEELMEAKRKFHITSN